MMAQMSIQKPFKKRIEKNINGARRWPRKPRSATGETRKIVVKHNVKRKDAFSQNITKKAPRLCSRAPKEKPKGG